MKLKLMIMFRIIFVVMASKLLQVLLNITFNAIKFTTEGKIR